MKRLYKIEEGKTIDGVCGGIANYLGCDPTLVRVGLIILMFAAGSGLLAYLICALVMPKKSDLYPDL